MVIERKYNTHTIRFVNGDSNNWLLDSPVYDFAIDDPNYGIGASKPSKKPSLVKQKNGSVLRIKESIYKSKDWDNKPADSSYFDLLLSSTRNQIIWGVNFYDYVFGKGRIVWDKLNGESDQMGCEIAYNSLNDRSDIVYYMWRGMMQGEVCSRNIQKAVRQIGNKKMNEKRYHPTQKPLKLCYWLLNNYYKADWTMFDGHGGSGNMAIACHNMKINLDIVELDTEIFETMVERFDRTTLQSALDFGSFIRNPI